MGEELSGLEALVEAIESLLRGEGLENAIRHCRRLRSAVSETLLDLATAEAEDVLEAYRGMLREGLEYLAEALAVTGVAGAEESKVLASLLAGAAVGEDCVLVELLTPMSTSGHVVGKGSLVCVEPTKAVLLERAGLARLLRKRFYPPQG